MESLCFGCFAEKNNEGVCPNCGYDPKSDEGKFSAAIKKGEILKERYIVGRVMGQGGFGVTYAALDFATGQRVAIKEFFPTALVSREASRSVSAYSVEMEEHFTQGKAGFLEEAHTLEKLKDSAHIVNVLDYFEENGTAYFVMDYVQGQNLKAYVKIMGGRLGEEAANRILIPIMEAMADVHAKGIVHRDIAPDNIIVTAEGSATLIDFGAARYSTGEKSMSLDVVLKHGYAPKEQYSRRSRQGPYTDVYAMAATYYYAVTGRVPPDAIDRTGKDELVAPSALGVKLSTAAEAAVLKALSVEPEDRFQSMEDFLKALKGEKMSEPEKKNLGKKKKKGGKSGKKTAIIIILFLLLAAAAAYVFFIGLPREENASYAPSNSAPVSCVEGQWEYSSLKASAFDERTLRIELTDERLPDEYTNSLSPGELEPWWNVILVFDREYFHVNIGAINNEALDDMPAYAFFDSEDNPEPGRNYSVDYTLEGNTFLINVLIPEESGYTVEDIQRIRVNHSSVIEGFSEGYDIECDLKSSASGETENTENTEEPSKAAAQPELIFEETEIYNNNGVQIVATDFVDNEYNIELMLSVNNNTNMDLAISSYLVSVNGCLSLAKAGFYERIAAGESAKVTCYISRDELADAGIDYIATLELLPTIYNVKTYEEWNADPVVLNIYDTESEALSLTGDGELLLDKLGVRVTSKGLRNGGLLLYVENSSGYLAQVSTRQMIIDGTQVQEDNVYYIFGNLGPGTVLQSELVIWNGEETRVLSETTQLDGILEVTLYAEGNYVDSVSTRISLPD